MYTTIEPRLIALLNNDSKPQQYTTSPSLELPPLQDPNILKASGRPLLLEPDTSQRSGNPPPNSQVAPNHATLILDLDDENKINENEPTKKTGGFVDRALGGSSPQSLRKILDDDPENLPGPSSKKRHIVDSSKDDFVQLPQPPKKQKAAKQVVPPIIIGLFEPPPQATLFPPIASSSFHDSHGRNSLNIVLPKVTELNEKPKSEKSQTVLERKSTTKKGAQKDIKTRKKWSEDETNNLLLGVHKHGVGKWTDILEDTSFPFNDRSAVDLKDRFRTCCPNELRETSSKPKTTRQRVEFSKRKGPKQSALKSSLMSENILVDPDESGLCSQASDPELSTKSRKGRAHRRNLEDLAQLGIEGPFRKSDRRERRPFSEEEDREILNGYNIYGPAWTQIQRDPRFHLQSRQPIDLRDRLRNKYPEKFRTDDLSGMNQLNELSRDEKKSDSPMKVDSRTNQTMTNLQPPSSREGLRIKQIISSGQGAAKAGLKAQLPIQSQMSNLIFKESSTPLEQPVDPADGLPFTETFDCYGNMNAPFAGSIGEMDISRLLLDESWIETTVKEKPQSGGGIHSIIGSGSILPPYA
jgi:hypothetical protein